MNRAMACVIGPPCASATACLRSGALREDARCQAEAVKMLLPGAFGQYGVHGFFIQERGEVEQGCGGESALSLGDGTLERYLTEEGARSCR
jgi:hypothetical protein